MTATTVRSGGNVRRGLAGGGGTVMAGGAATRDLRVIHLVGGLPRGRSMAALARRTRQNMRGVLTGRADAVVAARTTTGDTGVIKSIGYPGHGRVAGATIGRGSNMRCRLTRGCRAVVATGTGPLYLGVIHTGDWLPYRSDVAGFAQRAGGDVRGVLAGGA